MVAARVLLACSLAPGAWSQPRPEGPDPAPFDLPAPAPSTATVRPEARAVGPDTQRLLVEMWERGVILKGSRQWEAEDMKFLERLREAERLKAFDLLRERAGTLRGLAVNHKFDGGLRALWLTRAGFERYRYFKSQQARRYFEQKGTDAKWVFKVRDADGKKVFDSAGMLSEAGDSLYTRILLGLQAEWRDAGGEVRSNVRPKRPSASQTPPASRD